MDIPKILAGAVFNFLGVAVSYYGIKRRISAKANPSETIIDIVSGIAFCIIGILIWLGFIS